MLGRSVCCHIPNPKDLVNGLPGHTLTNTKSNCLIQSNRVDRRQGPFHHKTYTPDHLDRITPTTLMGEEKHSSTDNQDKQEIWEEEEFIQHRENRYE